MSQLPGFLTCQEAADLLNVSHATITRYCARKDNPLKHVKIGPQILIVESEARTYQRPPMGNPAFLSGKKRRSR